MLKCSEPFLPLCSSLSLSCLVFCPLCFHMNFGIILSTKKRGEKNNFWNFNWGCIKSTDQFGEMTSLQYWLFLIYKHGIAMGFLYFSNVL